MDNEKKKSEIKILIVEDAEQVTEVMKQMLSGYKIFSATNGKEAIEKCGKLKPDLVLLDIVMPVLDGIATLKQIKKIDVNAKIIIISAIDHPEVIKEAIKEGAMKYIVKPFSSEGLNEAVENALIT
jgi:two-component system chemotaxis response regulator CheY